MSSVPMTSARTFDVPTHESGGIVWKPIPSTTGAFIATGEIQFVDDIPLFQSRFFKDIRTKRIQIPYILVYIPFYNNLEYR